jgi:hypothetical protein
VWIGSNLERAQSGKMQPEDTDNVAATVIQMCGCLFHPQAREYLNAGAIKLLEARLENVSALGISRRTTLEESIRLLKEGAK